MEKKLTKDQELFAEISMTIAMCDFFQKNHRKPTREEFDKIADKVAHECALIFALGDALKGLPQPTQDEETDQKTDTLNQD